MFIITFWFYNHNESSVLGRELFRKRTCKYVRTQQTCEPHLL